MTPYPPTGRFAGRLFFAEPGDPPAVGDIVFRPQSFDVPEGAPYTVIAFVIRETLDSDGRYDRQLVTGTYDIEFRLRGVGVPALRGVRLREGETVDLATLRRLTRR
ncbi:MULTISPECIES: hypothetical protein [Microbacterium]|uniref:Uncharacterized protein n=1 Tax=Microbacterium hominis TaxID=162426 RepID=A0A2K9DSW0_9MICO|nr:MULTISPECIES: hypothetical protein [Microbacterium]AUG30366.1 hypothetical protein CXR34_13520 [Microbacterium hominis]